MIFDIVPVKEVFKISADRIEKPLQLLKFAFCKRNTLNAIVGYKIVI